MKLSLRKNIHIRVGIFLCVIQVLCWTGASASSEPLLTTNSPFVLYMQNPPWIKELIFIKNAFAEGGPVPGQINVKGWVYETNRLAIQPSGLFFEPLNINDVPLFPSPSPDQRVVLGVSDHYIWQGNVDSHALWLSSQQSEEGGSESNHLPTLIRVQQRYEINPVRYFGFPPLLINTFHLTDHNKFKATTTDGDLLKGEILDAADNRPVHLRYALSRNTNDYTLITYKYDTTNGLPNYFERNQPRNKNEYQKNLTNWIVTASYGIDSEIHQGYSPSMFFPSLGVFTMVMIESNAHDYVLNSKGRLKRASERYVSPSEVMGASGHGKSLMYSILIIFLVGSGVFVWAIARQRGNRNKP